MHAGLFSMRRIGYIFIADGQDAAFSKSVSKPRRAVIKSSKSGPVEIWVIDKRGIINDVWLAVHDGRYFREYMFRCLKFCFGLNPFPVLPLCGGFRFLNEEPSQMESSKHRAGPGGHYAYSNFFVDYCGYRRRCTSRIAWPDRAASRSCKVRPISGWRSIVLPGS